MTVDLLKKGRRKVLAWFDKIGLRFNHMLWEEAVRRTVISDKNTFFMEIGSWEGIGNDRFYPLVKKHKISGILIEPQEDAFRRLKENYAYHDKVIFENVAVAEKDCVKPLFFPPRDCRVMPPSRASLRKEVVENEIAFFQREDILPAGDYSQHIFSKPVQCLSVSSILKKHGINKVDIMQIDTEGYEYEILKSMPFDKIRPRIIRCEYAHMNKAGYRNSIKMLKKNGYSLILHEGDILALRNIRGIKKRLFFSHLIQFTRKIVYKAVFWPQRKFNRTEAQFSE